jgi:hypothetical protein
MTARFDRWTALTVSALGTVLWAVLPILKGDGVAGDSWWRAVGGIIALVVGSLSTVQLVRQRRAQDSATELQLNTRNPR